MDDMDFSIGKYPRYPLVTLKTMAIAFDILRRRQRNLRIDSAGLISKFRPPMQVEGNLPGGPVAGRLIVVNHYNRPKFQALWIGVTISAIYPTDIRWITTTTWIYPDRLRSALLTPIIGWFIKRIAHCYGITSMPPMPPRPWEVQQRAQAVRSVLRHIQQMDPPVIGLSPEGRDSPDEALTEPPPGVGRFVCHLAEQHFDLLPVGLYEREGKLFLRLGEVVPLPRIDGKPDERDTQMSDYIMNAIAACLPKHLRGRYG